MKIVGLIHGELPSARTSPQNVIDEFVESALRQIKQEKRLGIKTEVMLKAIISHRNRESLLDGELLCNILQKAGVIESVKQIVSKEFEKTVNDIDPKVAWSVETTDQEK